MLLLLAACGGPVGPAPSIDSVSPDLLCHAGAPSVVEVHGAGFAPAASGVLVDAALGLPRLSLVRTGTLSGVDDGDDRVVEVPGAWVDATAFVFEASPAMGLVPGAWTLVVTNPDGQVARREDALLVAAPPAVTEVDPGEVCVASTAVALGLAGADFLVIAGAHPTLTLGAGDPLPTAADDCAPLAGDRDGAVCTRLSATLDASVLPVGSVPLTVTNPGACASTMPATLEVVLPPEILAVDPASTCAAGGRVRILGERFPEAATVTIGGVAAAEVAWIDAGTIDVVLAEGTPAGLVDVTVSGTDGCDATALLDVVGGPDVFFVDPPGLYQGLSVQVTAYIADVTGAVEAVWIEASGTVTPLAFGWDPAAPGRVTAVVPSGMPAGSYAFGVSAVDGCATELAGALSVADTLDVAIEAVDPAYAWRWDYTPIQVTASDPVPTGQVGFSATPRLYLTPSGGGTTAAAVGGVVFRGEGLLTATVPVDLAPGLYDVLAVNPDGAVGLLEAGLEVTDAAPPRVDSASPPGLSNSRDETVILHGAYFREPSVAIECDDGTGVTPATVTASTYTSISAVIPSSAHNEAVCVVIVTNVDGPSARWAAISIRNPASNLFGWQAGTEMVEARRGPAAVAGRTSAVSRWVYALGGDEGDVVTARTSVERAPVGVYGDLGAWELLEGALPAPFSLGGAVIVGDFAYALGGNDGSGPVASVWRAHILDPLDVPRLDALSIEAGGALGPGDWTWRVAALYDAADAANPGGESLPGDPIVVTLPDRGGLTVGLAWTEMPDAVGYRVYRSSTAGDDATEWVGDTADTLFFDVGDATDPSQTPLPEGALGAWAILPSMLEARESPCLAVAPDPVPDPEVVHLYVAGGRSAGGDALDSIEVLDITIVSDDEQGWGAWAPASASLSAARWGCGAYTVDDALHTVVAADESWVYFAGGESGDRTTGVVDAGRVGERGELLDWQTAETMSPTRSGFAVASASDTLYAFGGQGGRPTAGGVSTDLTAGALPDLQNWNNLGTSLTEARHLAGSTQESSILFVLGGETETSAASRSTDVSNY